MAVKVFQMDPSPDQEFGFEREAIARAGGELIVGSAQTEDDVLEQGADAEIIWVSWLPLLTRRVLEQLPNARLLMRWGVGYDQIPVKIATELGIAVANAPAYGTDDVAEHAIALLVSTARQVPWYHNQMAGGGWGLQLERPIHRMKGRTLGVIGVGRIGGAAARRGVGLGMRVLGYDKYRPADELREMGVEPVGLQELLAESDYVTIHTPLNDETRGLIGEGELAKLKPEVILVNTSRGPVIDQAALIDVMRNRRIAAAALDVFEYEPLDAQHELRNMDNVIVTPHMAGYSVEAMADLRADMCNTVAEWIRDSWSGRVLNPEVRDHLRPRRSN